MTDTTPPFNEFAQTLQHVHESTRYDQEQLASAFGFDNYVQWERGNRLPSQTDLERILTLLNPSKASARNLKRIHVQCISQFTWDWEPQVSASRPNRSEELEYRFERIQERVTQLAQRAEAQDEALLESLQDAIAEAQATSHDLAPPIVLPPMEDLQIRLVSTNSLQRLEEYRSEENLLLSFAGLFLGALLGILTNLITGGTIQTEMWLFVVLLLLMTAFTAWRAIINNRRAASVKRQMFNEPEQK